jgi:BirA family transcriptional regulator, biotin operon repressor / biotin---[acetyl-CoA-carboxylase] ligase
MKTINPVEIQRQIKNNKILNKLVYLDSIDSTNKFLAENDFASGTVVMAAEQSAGRGKHGAAWVSPRGGLWLSFVINRKIKRPYDYVVLSSVAIAESLKKYGIKAEIKWPNDIMAGGKKLAGMLLENDYFSGRLITGLGINVNNRTPKGLNAISIKQLLKKPADTASLAVDIVKILDSYISGFKTKRAVILGKWMAYQKNLEGTEINLAKGKTVRVIKVSGGSIKVIDKKSRVYQGSGEVFFK